MAIMCQNLFWGKDNLADEIVRFIGKSEHAYLETDFLCILDTIKHCVLVGRDQLSFKYSWRKVINLYKIILSTVFSISR